MAERITEDEMLKRAEAALARKRVPLPPCEERRRLREDAGLSMADVASVLGSDTASITNWERIERGPRDREKRALYATLLKRLGQES